MPVSSLNVLWKMGTGLTVELMDTSFIQLLAPVMLRRQIFPRDKDSLWLKVLG
jgi:hypothetical protein